MTSKNELISEAYYRLGGNATAVSQELQIPRTTVRDTITRLRLNKKPIVSGSIKPIQTQEKKIPTKGVKRYILTSMQNNTYVHKDLWNNLKTYAQKINAEIFIGTYSYNREAYGKLSTKRNSEEKDKSTQDWFDPTVSVDYLVDQRIKLAPGLIWCGEMNIIPTASRPLSGLESYTKRSSSIFPHAKFALESIASGKHEPTKFNYTTGTITLRNYIQKKVGLKSEPHHSYGALIVEVDCNGNWFVRQLNAQEDGTFYDLDIKVEKGHITEGHRLEAVTWGDFHCDRLNQDILTQILEINKELRPKYQFIHDILNFRARNHHDIKNHHARFERWVCGTDDLVEHEINECAKILNLLNHPDTNLIVVNSNHDNALDRWLLEADYREDPPNALFFLEAQLERYRAIKNQDDFCIVEWSILRAGAPKGIRFLRPDESFLICDSIECGFHGHLGPNGSRGTPLGLSKIGHKANIGHTHSAGIYDGLYVAGTSSDLDLDYNKGPSSWSHSHIFTYPNGKRTIITMWENKWRG